MIATAFHPEFVIMTDCELFGRMPSDHDAESSQLLLVGFIQEFTWAKIEMELKAITHDAAHNARPIPFERNVAVCIDAGLFPDLAYSKTETSTR